MIKNLFVLFSLLLISSSCLLQKKAISTKNIKQGVAGKVFLVAGNQMPAPNAPKPQPKPISTTIYIYKLTNVSQVVRVDEAPIYRQIFTSFVDSVTSNKEGFFYKALPVGNYSLFTKVNGMFYANAYDDKNNIQPINVQKDSIAQITIQISNNAVY